MTPRKKTVDLEQMLAEDDAPEWKLRFEADNRYLRDIVYAGLNDLNDGFDSPLIGHFTPKDFLTLIDRCESLQVRIIGIEVFKIIDVGPPSKVMLLEIEISPEPGYKWARRLVQSFLRKRRITVCATFEVPGQQPDRPANESSDMVEIVEVLGGDLSKMRGAGAPEASTDPAVGIFFVRNNDLWVDSTPVNDALRYGDDMMTHDKGHDTFWGELQTCCAVPVDEEYDEISRGRVSFNTKTHTYHILLDGCILKNRKIVQDIFRVMNPPPQPATEIGLDSHYRCPGCIPRSAK